MFLGIEKPEEVSNSVQKPLDADASKEKKQPAAQKKKRKSNVEKSLEVVMKKFQESSNNDFLRYSYSNSC